MKLRQIFTEADKTDKFADVLPGARVSIENLDFDQLKALNKKIADYESTLGTYSYQKVPKALRASVDTLKSQIQDTIDHLYAKQVEAKKEYIGEIPPKFKELLDTIGEECSEIMDAYKRTGAYLYRGVKNNTDAFKGKPFDERRAKDSDQRLSDDLNAAFEAAGIAARRDNSIFTSASTSQAANYGTTYIVFPIDGFSFSSSSKIKDFIFDFYKFKEYFLPKDELKELDAELKKIDDDTLRKYFGTHHYYPAYKEHDYIIGSYDDFKAIEGLIEGGHLDPKWKKFSSPRDLMTPEAVVDKLGMFWGDINRAINTKHEVTIRAPFYAINSKHEHIVNEYLEKIYKPDLNKSDNKEVLKVGDSVEITDGANKGEQGTITVVHNSKNYFDIELASGKTAYSIAKSVLKKLNVDADVVVGDYVEILKGSKQGQKGKIVYIYKSGVVDIEADNGDVIYDISKSNIKKIENAKVEYKLGDKVEMISAKHAGKTGTVDYVYKNKIEVDVNLDDGTFLFSIPVTDLKPFDPKSTVKSDEKFKTNDKVMFTGSKYAGKTGSIEYVYINQQEVDITLDDGTFLSGIPKTDIKKFDPKTAATKDANPDQLKKGDKVLVLLGTEAGFKGIVDYIDGDKVDLVDQDNFFAGTYKLKNLQKIEDKPKQGSIEDLDQANVNRLIAIGKKKGYVTYAQVDKVAPSSKFTSEQIEDLINVLSELDIEVVENAPEQKSEPKAADTDFDLIDLSVLEVPDVGDTVTIKNHPNPDFNGEKVTVTASKLAMDNASYVVTVKFSNGSTMTMYDKYLYKG